MAARFLDDEARAAFQRAIETIERASAAEVVIAVRRRAGAHLHANVIVGVAAAIAGLAAMLFGEHVFGLGAILVDPFLLGGLAGALVELTPDIKRLLTPPAARRRATELAARATFVERGVHRTIGRSGLLVYIAWLERRVELVADVELAKKWPATARDELAARMTAAMRTGGTAVATLLAAASDAIAAAMPHRDDDVNELPDAIDSDLERP